MEDIQQKIVHLASQFLQDTIKIRRYIHQHPDLSGHEQPTADYVFQTLENYGIKSYKALNNNAIIALIEGQKEGQKEGQTKTIALRADMDALPIKENNDVVYKSLIDNVMHACGHDVHTASLLTVARILNLLKNEFSGNVRLIFQPSEEQFPGGAFELLQCGVLENPKIDLMLGCHVSPEIKTGAIGLKSGIYMASTDEIYLTIYGKAGHAALEDTFINPLLIAAEILLELEHFCRNYAPQNVPSVLTFGQIEGKGATNIVPQKVDLAGTFRTFDEAWRTNAHKQIENIANRIATARNGNAITNIKKGYPVLINDENSTLKMQKIAQEMLGKENVLTLKHRMTAEDFAYYSHHFPSVFYRVGTKIDGIDCNLHTPNFNINENALQIAPAVMSYMAFRWLNE
ncbi:MAG: amidohydrolase [Bacteroidales bacterium]|jgi:amidohydrolase|nr:amidohydrolase [Bacteroidales bacterium]